MSAAPNAFDLQVWKERYRSVQIERSPDCLSETQFMAMILKRVHGAARRELADHVVACRRCTEIYQLLLRLPSSGT